MHEIGTEIEIAAPPECVWSILIDFAAYAHWNPFIRAIEGVARQGSVLKVRLKPGDASQREFRSTVLMVDRPRELRWRRRLLLPLVFDREHRFLIEPLTDATVRFCQREKSTGILVPLLPHRFESSALCGFAAMNVALKQRAEAATKAAATDRLASAAIRSCVIVKVLGADGEGRAVFGDRVEESCAVIKLPGDKSNVATRIGSAPDYPVASEGAVEVVVMLPRTTHAEVGDRLELAGLALRVVGISSSFDSIGKLEQYVVEATPWD